MHAVAECKKVFLSGKASFCRFGSLGSGNFASNSASKIVETSSALGWNHLYYSSCGKSCERVITQGNGLLWLGNCEMQSVMMLLVVDKQSALIPTVLLIMTVHWRVPRAFQAGDRLVPLRIHALDATLSVKKNAVG